MVEDEPDRLLRRRATRARDAGHGHCDVRSERGPRSSGHRLGGLRRDGAVLPEDGLGDTEEALLRPVGVGDDGSEEDLARAGNVGEPRADEPTCAGLRRPQSPPPPLAEVEHECGDGTLVLDEELAGEALAEESGQRCLPLEAVPARKEVDSDLEVVGAHRRLDGVPLSPGLLERPGDRRLAGAEEAEHRVLRPLDVREHSGERLARHEARPEPLELVRRAGQGDRDAPVVLEEHRRRRPGQAECRGPLREGRLLLHPRLEVRVRPPQALCDPAGERLDLAPERLVYDERPPGHPGEHLDRAVVVRGAQAAREDAEVRGEPLAQSGFELRRVVPDDEQAGRLEA